MVLVDLREIRLPPDEGLRNLATDNNSSLVLFYFQFWPYLLASCSGPGDQPANLRGMWNHMMNQTWNGKYTITINTGMN